MTRYVITGGASCGKTSVINELKRRGYEVVRETARDIITKRYTNEVDEKEMLKRQKLIFHDQIIREDNLEKGLVFLDRGLIDVLAYSRLFLKKIPKNILNHRYSKRYSGVFVLERLSLEKDGLRFEKEDCEVEKI
jgi:predicted ATPase